MVPGTGNITTAGTLTLPNSNTITGVASYAQFSNGISVGGGTTYRMTNTGVITANTTGSINGLNINAGALSGVTGYAQTSGAFAFSGGGNFSIASAGMDVTTAGAVSNVTTLGMNGVLTNSNATSTAITLSGNAAGISFTGAAANTNTINTSNNNHLYINTGTGNVGIGSSAPTSFKLEVAGDIGPDADGTRDIGSPSRYYDTVYANNVVGLGALGYWSRGTGVLFPSTTTDGVAATGSATTVATFTSTGTNDALRTGGSANYITVSPSGDLSFTGANADAINKVSGTLNINTTNNQAITTGTGQVTLAGNVDATNGLDVTTANLTVGGANFTVVPGTGNITTAGTVSIATGQSYTGAGTVTLSSAAASSLTINSGTTGAIAIGNDASAETIGLGTGAAAKTITIGNTTGATALNQRVGTGNYTLDGVAGSTYAFGASTTTGTMTIGGTAQTGLLTLGQSSGTNIVAIGSGTGATTVQIANGATNGKTVQIATGAVANTVSMGSTTGASATTLNAGSGNLTLNATSGNVALQTTTAGNITLTPGGTGDINITADADSFVNIAGLTDSTGTSLCLDGSSNLITCAGGGTGNTLQAAYDNGNTITTTTARNIAFTLGEVATPTSLTLENQDTAGTNAQRIFNSIASGTLTNGLLVEQTGAGTMTSGINITQTAGTISSGLTFTGITNDITTGANQHLALMPNGTGNVGIGTTSPAYNLEIEDVGDAAIYLEADSAGTGSEDNNAFIKLSQDGLLVQSIFGTVGNAGYDPENVAYTNTLANATLLGTLDNNGALQFGTNDAVRMTIAATGNVGIGTTSPTLFNLQVTGNIGPTTTNNYDLGLTGTRWRTGYFGTSLDSPSLTYAGTLALSATGANIITMSTNGSERWRVASNGVLQSNGAQTIQTSTGNLTLATAAGNGHILLSPNGTGNVGVGTTTPTSFKLEVAGNIGPDSDITRNIGAYNKRIANTYTGVIDESIFTQAGENAIKNSDRYNGGPGGWGTAANYSEAVVVGPQGTEVRAITNSTPLSTAGLLTDYLPVDPKKAYLLEYWIKQDDISAGTGTNYIGREEYTSGKANNDQGTGPYTWGGQKPPAANTWYHVYGIIPPHDSGAEVSHTATNSTITPGTEYKFWSSYTAYIRVKIYLNYNQPNPSQVWVTGVALRPLSSGGVNSFFATPGDASTSGNLAFVTGKTERLTITSNGNVGIGTTAPATGAKLDVYGGPIRLGANTSANNQLNTTAGSAPSGDLYWGSRTICDDSGNCGTAGVSPDSLDYTEFLDTMTLDANLILNQTTYTWTQNFTGTTTTGYTYNANSLTSGKALSIASSATAFTGTLAQVSLTGNNAANTGTIFKASSNGALNTGTVAMITNLGAGTSFRVNDETGDADTTPFLIDAGGNVGIGTTSPVSKLLLDDVTPTITGWQSLTIRSTDALAIDKGGTIGFGGKYTSGGTYATWAGIAGLKENATDSNTSGYLSLRTRANGGNLTEQMRIASNGNVGIGTTNPSLFKLQVTGNIGPTTTNNYDLGLTGTRWRTGYFGTSLDSPSLTYAGTLALSATGANIITMSTNGSERWRVASNGVLQSNGAQTIQTSTGNLTLATAAGNGHILLSPNGTGNVGIGTTAPSNPLAVISTTTPQLRVGYDNTTNYFTSAVASNGSVTFNANGASAAFTFSDPTTISSTANPGLTVGNGTTGYLKIGGSTISDAAGNLTLDSDSGTISASDILNMGWNAITGAWIGDADSYGGGGYNNIANHNNNLIRADEKETVTMNNGCDAGSIANMFDGDPSTICQLTDAAPNEIITIDMGSYEHYWTGFEIMWTYDRGTNNVTIEKYWDPDSTGGCDTWATIYSGAATGYSTKVNAPGNYICQYRITITGTPDVANDVRIGDIRGFQYYNDQKNDLYADITGATFYGAVQVGTSTTNRDLDVYGNVGIVSSNTTGTTTSSSLGLSANSLTTGTGLYAASSTLTSGKLVDLQVSGTAAAASQTGLNILTAGANGTAGITSYGAQISNTHTGTTSTNVALYLNASGGTTANYGLIVNAGNVGIGTTAPGAKLDVYNPSGTTLALAAQVQNLNNATGQNGLLVNVARVTTDDATYGLNVQGGGTSRLYVRGDGFVGIGTTAQSANWPTDLLFINGEFTADKFNDSGSNNRYIDPNGTSRISYLEMRNDLTFIDAGNAGIGKINSNGSSVIIEGPTGGTTDLCVEDPDTGTGGECDGKIDAGTIDPPYTINGKKYATYMASMTGVKEETTDTVHIESKIAEGRYAYVIDFNNQPIGSDLWLFSKTTHLKDNLDHMSVLLTPTDDTRTWYKVDNTGDHLTLILYSSRPTQISYRLTAPRFNAENFANIRPDNAPGGFLINDPDIIGSPYTITEVGSLTDTHHIASTQPTNTSLESLRETIYQVVHNTSGEMIEEVAVFNKILIGKIQAGFVEAQNAVVTNVLNASHIVSENISSYSLQVTKLFVNEKIISPIVETTDLSASGTATLATIKTDTIKPQEQNVTIDLNTSSDKGTFAKLIVNGINNITVASIDEAGNATFAGSLTSVSVISDQLSVNDATISGSLTANEASLSGKLIAKEIVSDNISELTERTAAVEEQSGKTAEVNEVLSNSINQVQQDLAAIKNLPLPNPAYYQNLSDYPVATVSSLLAQSIQTEDLTATGNVNLYKASIADSLTAGTIFMQDNSILSLSWELKLSALAQITLFDGSVVIAKNGNITTKGELIAEGGVRTDEIQSIDGKKDIAIKLNSQLSNSNENSLKNAKLKIENSEGMDVASIDASGAARLNSLAFTHISTNSAIIADSGERTVDDEIIPAIETNAEVAGTGVLPVDAPEIIIYNNSVTADSLIYLTPIGETPINQLTVVKKEIHGRPYFSVSSGTTLHPEIKFNWLIIN